MSDKTNAQQQTIGKTLALFNSGCQQFSTRDELQQHAQDTAALAIALVRGMAGDEFANGFLLGALNDPKPLRITPETKN